MQIRFAAELRSGVARDRERQFGRRDPHPVVGDANQALPALLELDPDLRRAGVDRVLEELLHDGGGTLDHLPRGDLVHEVEREELNPAFFTKDHIALLRMGTGSAQRGPA